MYKRTIQDCYTARFRVRKVPHLLAPQPPADDEVRGDDVHADERNHEHTHLRSQPWMDGMSRNVFKDVRLQQGIALVVCTYIRDCFQ